MNELGNTVIVLIGLLGAILLLAGVGFSAYSRMKKISRNGMRLGDLLREIEETLEKNDGEPRRLRVDGDDDAEESDFAPQSGEADEDAKKKAPPTQKE